MLAYCIKRELERCIRRKTVLITLLTICLIGPACSENKPLYQPSQVISGVSWDFSSRERLAPGSDNWPITWADDNNLYTSWGDGGGFEGTDQKYRVKLGVARIAGSAENYSGQKVWDGEEGRDGNDGKAYGILSISSTLYMWVMPENVRGGRCQLYYSNNRGRDWHKSDCEFQEHDHAFTVCTFLNYGKDYDNARDHYVYTYAPDVVTDYSKFADGVALARVPKNQLLNKKAYEFFKGMDPQGRPAWTKNIAERKHVFRARGKVGWVVSVSYIAGLKRYILATAHDLTGGLALYDAPEPWGPWTTVAIHKNWGSYGYTFSYYFPSKWISTDGQFFTLVFSGTGYNDAWNTVRGKFLLRSSNKLDNQVQLNTTSSVSNKERINE